MTHILYVVLAFFAGVNVGIVITAGIVRRELRKHQYEYLDR